MRLRESSAPERCGDSLLHGAVIWMTVQRSRWPWNGSSPSTAGRPGARSVSDGPAIRSDASPIIASPLDQVPISVNSCLRNTGPSLTLRVRSSSFCRWDLDVRSRRALANDTLDRTQSVSDGPAIRSDTIE